MKKKLCYQKQTIMLMYHALKQAGYTPIIKTFYHGNNIAMVIYSPQVDATQEIAAIIDSIVDKEVDVGLRDYHENYFCIGKYESNPGDNPENPIVINSPIGFPSYQIYKVFTLRRDLTESYPDGNSSYFPDTIILYYKNQWYQIDPLDQYQGNIRRRYWHLVKPLLEALGCQQIYYREGKPD